MAITVGKYILAMMRSEMLFVLHVHQPVVASPQPSEWMMLSRVPGSDHSLWLLFGGSWDDLGVDFSLLF